MYSLRRGRGGSELCQCSDAPAHGFVSNCFQVCRDGGMKEGDHAARGRRYVMYWGSYVRIELAEEARQAAERAAHAGSDHS